MNKTEFVIPAISPTARPQRATNGAWVELDGESFFRISDAYSIPEFFICLTSSSDHWMFVTSAGALTAGRCDANRALFPYYAADKIIDSRWVTGPRTIVRVNTESESGIWQPFFGRIAAGSGCVRNVYKNRLGNKLWLEEINSALGLAFRYRWTFSHQSGFIRTSRITNLGSQAQQLEIVDGIQNVMPYGIDQNFQLRFGNLADAYKKNELIKPGIGIYYLSSIPTDRAEPSEGLRATVAWNTAKPERILLSDEQLEKFLAGEQVEAEQDIRGRRGAYLLNFQLDLAAGTTSDWEIVADLDQDQTDVANLVDKITRSDNRERLAAEVAECERLLQTLVAKADGLQSGGNRERNQRHLSNVLFNIMRGGIPLDDYSIDSGDFRQHVRLINQQTESLHREFLIELPAVLHHDELVRRVRGRDDGDLLRIAMEYLPLIFSRRHGDPTRPWNSFAIRSHLGDDQKSFDYQGNWRDIFQNWEALAFSYPGYLECMIARFVNASTADGYNPYRITKHGFEWEEIDGNDPWSNIGYWGDHQIVYLSKLLEMASDYFPGRLDQLLNEEVFVYAHVPYRIKSADAMFRDPRNTIDYDRELADAISKRVTATGNDGKLLSDDQGRIQKASLAEKILVPTLVKLTNFVPGGGIWLNTQRPEWNDANNALVGNGLSMVTTCYLRRHLALLISWFESSEIDHIKVSTDVAELQSKIQLAMQTHVAGMGVEISPAQRYQLVRELTQAGSDYREKLYQHALAVERSELSVAGCCDFFRQCLGLLDDTIRSNRRSDGLYHSYNLMSLDIDGEIQIERLYEMLEGQVAVLSSGILSTAQVVEVLDALRSSSLYREDQMSFMLYPNRSLPRFMEKNLIPRELVNQSTLLQQLIDCGDQSIIRQDVNGDCHFNGDFRNSADVVEAIRRLHECSLHPLNTEATVEASQQLANIFEHVFSHHQFTGRSGTFFAYEGLGSIYWHMVSKLALAVAENYVKARQNGTAPDLLERLKHHFREIRRGIGAEKTPAEYGAFPGDPYSHTPFHLGAQQPGMTGQVKEDILSRFIELGVRIRHGQISFEPSLLEQSELKVLAHSEINLNSSHGDNQPTDQASLMFTICEVPVVLVADSQNMICIEFVDGTSQKIDELVMSIEQSHEVFTRSGNISSIKVVFDQADLS